MKYLFLMCSVMYGTSITAFACNTCSTESAARAQQYYGEICQPKQWILSTGA